MGLQEAFRYLSPSIHSFWKWNIEEQSIQWPDGTTIAFSKELAILLGRFAPCGLPRFDCVVLLFAALRDSWADASCKAEREGTIKNFLEFSGLDLQVRAQLIGLLNGLNELPADLRHPLGAKNILIELVLDGMMPRCEGVEIGGVQSCLLQSSQEFVRQCELALAFIDKDAWVMDLSCLIQGLERVDEKRIRSRIATGLDHPVQPAKELLEEPYSDSIEARELVDALIQAREFYSLGRLAKDLLAALHRPAKMVPQSSLHHEGYSDITNRGTVDRLLISELAQDDDTLAVRIANNEAMYMRREVPPSVEAADRLILIDCGIRTWGTPRVYHAAIALALTASAKSDANVLAWRAVGGRLERSFFVDESGLREHMSVLDAGLHPGLALREFAEKTAALKPNSEVYMILSQDAWHDPDFRVLLQQLQFRNLELCVVDRYGCLELVSYSSIGFRTQKQVLLNLVDPPKTHGATSVPLIANNRFPKIFHCSPFPLRLSLPKAKFFIVDKNLVLGATPFRALVLWESNKEGGRILLSRLPKGEVLWAGFNRFSNRLWVIWGRFESEQCFLEFQLPDGALLERTEIQTATNHAAKDTGSGTKNQPLNSIAAGEDKKRALLANEHVWAHDQYNLFPIDNHGWSAVQSNGLGFDTVPISFGKGVAAKDLLFAMTAPATDGYVALTKSGKLFHSNGESDQRAFIYGQEIQQGSPSPLGNNRWIRFSTNMGNYVYEISDGGKIARCHSFGNRIPTHSSQQLAWENHSSIQHPNYRCRFDKIAIVDGCLALIRNRDVLALSLKGGSWYWTSHKALSPQQDSIAFQKDLSLTCEAGYRIEVASRNSFEAVLDAHGLLHLRSLRSALTEITFIISEGIVSGWTSDGQWFGIPFHCGENLRSPVVEIDEKVLRPLLDEMKKRTR